MYPSVLKVLKQGEARLFAEQDFFNGGNILIKDPFAFLSAGVPS